MGFLGGNLKISNTKPHCVISYFKDFIIENTRGQYGTQIQNGEQSNIKNKSNLLCYVF